MITRVPCELEIDHRRGVIYVHLTDADDVTRRGVATAVRISGLPRIPPLLNRSLNIGLRRSNMVESGFVAQLDWADDLDAPTHPLNRDREDGR